MGSAIFSATRIFVIAVLCLLVASCVHVLHTYVDRTADRLWMIEHSESHRSLLDPNEPIMSEDASRLFWFMQVTDVHFSVFQDETRVSEFRRFCTEIIPLIQPEFVSVSGDLTDARARVHIRSNQLSAEWLLYESVVRESGILNWTTLMDIRGNHDMFGVQRSNLKSDMFRKYAIQGPVNARSYAFTLEKEFGNYSFINLDASPNIGLNFPLNFFGELTQTEELHVRTLMANASRSNHTIWFGHYPTSTVISQNLRKLIGDSAFAYLCGHLHTAAHLIPRMYVLQPEGFLELELGDWRGDRYYRIVAVDHDLVSFVDTQMLQGKPATPVILVTNPKDSTFLLPHKEPAYRIARSTHIRMLIWSATAIHKVTVSIDGAYLGVATRSAAAGSSNRSSSLESPLFTLAWNATRWADKRKHELHVTAIDAAGNRREVQQPFVVNAPPTWNYSPMASFILLTDHSVNLKILFYTCEAIVGLLLIIPRLIPRRFTRSTELRSRCLRGLFRFSHTTSLLVPNVIFLIYQCCGPIFMGYLVGSHFGIVFSFGIFIAGSFVHESLTFLYEFTQLSIFALFHLPYVIWACGQCWRTVQQAKSKTDTAGINTHTEHPQDNLIQTDPDIRTAMPSIKSPHATCHLIGSIPLALFIHSFLYTCLQLIFIVTTISVPYGLLATCLSPGRIAPIVLSWYTASRIPLIV